MSDADFEPGIVADRYQPFGIGSLTNCTDCGAVVALNMRLTHDDFHDRLVFSEVR